MLKKWLEEVCVEFVELAFCTGLNKIPCEEDCVKCTSYWIKLF
jgi:hypothetical protein